MRHKLLKYSSLENFFQFLIISQLDMPVVPTAQETEARGSPESMNLKLPWEIFWDPISKKKNCANNYNFWYLEQKSISNHKVKKIDKNP
jgi:hypothetical protein